MERSQEEGWKNIEAQNEGLRDAFQDEMQAEEAEIRDEENAMKEQTETLWDAFQDEVSTKERENQDRMDDAKRSFEDQRREKEDELEAGR